MNKCLEALLDLGYYYNGFEDHIKKMIDYIKTDEYSDLLIRCPKYLVDDWDDYDSYMRVVWSTLVMWVGEYGTSPRFGWLLKKKSHPCDLTIHDIMPDIDEWLKDKYDNDPMKEDED